jgi:hypothetical protein
MDWMAEFSNVTAKADLYARGWMKYDDKAL